MARGLSRELSKAANDKKKAQGEKGNKEDLTPSQRAERDAKAMKEKKDAKDAERAALAASGEAGAAAVADELAKKAAFREKSNAGK